MNSVLEPGCYVVAVSGGVDSMVLLDMLTQQPSLQLVVAHIDHGIRTDSKKDRLLVQQVAATHSLPFVYHEAQLGAEASEAQARLVRYEFLRRVVNEHNAIAIITAHHQDDVLETAILSIMRDKGRKGLTSLSSRTDIKRPLLHLSKRQLIAYAEQQSLVWREDSTNADIKYARNYVRHRIAPRLKADERQEFLKIIASLSEQNQQIDDALAELYDLTAPQLDRLQFIILPHTVATEIIAAWLRAHGLRQFDAKHIERLTVVAKTAQPNTVHDIYDGVRIYITDKHLALKGLER